MPINPKRLVLWSIIALLMVWILIQEPLAQLSRIAVYSDFMGYWASTRLFLSGKNPYDASALSAMFDQYGRSASRDFIAWAPPWIYLLLCPFALLPISVARLLWFVLNCSIMVAFVDFMWTALGGPKRHLWLLRLTAILFIPSALALNLGQTSPMTLAGLHGFLSALKRRRYLLAGAATYLLMIKPHIVYLFWYFLLLWIIKQRNYRLGVGTIIGIAAPSLFSYAINPLIYVHYIRAITSSQGPIVWATPTVATMLRYLSDTDGILIQLIPTVIGLLVSTFLWTRWHDIFNWHYHIADVFTISVITSIYSWPFDWVVFLPTILMILVWVGGNVSRHWPWAILLLVTQVALGVQCFAQRNYIVTFWFPIVIGVCYLYHKRRYEIEK